MTDSLIVRSTPASYAAAAVEFMQYAKWNPFRYVASWYHEKLWYTSGTVSTWKEKDKLYQGLIRGDGKILNKHMIQVDLNPSWRVPMAHDLDGFLVPVAKQDD